jgi:ATP-binding cassette, subfamily B, bacterial
LALVIRAVRLVASTQPWYLAVVVILSLGESTVPAAAMWLVKQLVDETVEVVAGTLASTALVPQLAMLGGILLVGQVARALRSTAQSLLQNLVTHRVNVLILTKAAGLDLAYFELPSYYDRLQRAQQEAGFRPFMLVQTSLQTLQSGAAVLSIMGLLLWVSPIGTLLVVLSLAPLLWVQAHFGHASFDLVSGRTPDARRMAYFAHLLSLDAAAKEVKLFGLASPLLDSYVALFRRFYAADRRLLVRRELATLGAGLLSAVAVPIAAGFLLTRVIEGTLTLGDLMLFYQGLLGLLASMAGLAFAGGALFEGSLFLTNLFGFLDFVPERRIQGGTRLVPQPLQKGFEFEGVTFTYPGSAAPALQDVSFRISAGGVVALVGENGAGKTTLVKLLARLYDPDSGCIQLDGRPLSEYDRDDLHRHIAVVFQDHMRYHATASDNIRYGRIELAENADAIRAAAEQAGANRFLEALPEGYETMLGKWFDGGHELSAGQWQSVALARAFLRDAQILVLDEPTAALDARAEFELFQRFRELAKGRTVLLISHRFSTVQSADQIVVLDHGRVVACGSHPELVAQNGLYADLFNRQATAYR